MKKKHAKLISIFMCFVLVLFAFGCQSNTESAFKAGKYTGIGKGIHGDIKVEVEVDDTKILSVKVLEHSETPGVSDPAIAKVPQEIVDGQTVAVDIVSGATYTSNGIIEGTKAALTEAGGDMEKLSQKKEDTTERKTEELTTDVVVIGAGGAGLAAATSANQNGAKVIVLEKMGKAGGNTAISGAAFNAVDTELQKEFGIEDSIDKHFQQTYEGGDKLADPELVEILVNNALPAIKWLESLGMEFEHKIFTVLGGMWPRAHDPEKVLGTGFIDTHMEYAEKSNGGVEVKINTNATELIKEGDRIVGVKAEGEDTDYVIKATKGVVIATGGFSQNKEMRDKYNKQWEDISNLMSTNHPGATGDGIIMAEKAGANLVGMEWIQLLPMGDPETGSLSGNIEQGVEDRIFINLDGNRFVDEGARRDVMTKALLEQKDQTMWTILDSHSYPTGDEENHFGETANELVKAGRAFKADTLEELAEMIGVDADSLVKAVEGFNKGVDEGKDEFGRTLFKDKIDKGPYYAGKRVPTVHHTMGGIQINTKAQAINAEGNVIPGLYAAGEVTGGIHGSNRLGGNALADINVFGKIAGESAAKGL